MFFFDLQLTEKTINLKIFNNLGIQVDYITYGFYFRITNGVSHFFKKEGWSNRMESDSAVLYEKYFNLGQGY